ncbi:spliceosome-associated protein CWC15 homolog [Manis pentadactyla]|uniref:spliceosome-associated protein CWC15 homolog n=1 Tax=Manis pentadactyla TaxID=143292 RepID=UPI00255C89AE|nr:spliceosome-associated protein CWC15 homolog [Manis pentadactyla]
MISRTWQRLKCSWVKRVYTQLYSHSGRPNAKIQLRASLLAASWSLPLGLSAPTAVSVSVLGAATTPPSALLQLCSPEHSACNLSSWCPQVPKCYKKCSICFSKLNNVCVFPECTTSSSVSKKPRLDQILATNLHVDDPLTDEEDEDEDFEEESDDDGAAALLAELEKIKKERAEEQARKEQEQKAEEERIYMENILSGNPLLNLTGPSQPQANFKVKRSWDDDVVFKNCAKGVDDQKKDKRFVNDTLQSEFHKKFMEKYIK